MVITFLVGLNWQISSWGGGGGKSLKCTPDVQSVITVHVCAHPTTACTCACS